MTRLPALALALALVGLAGTARAVDPAATESVGTERGPLAAIRDDLVELRIERALAAIEALLADPSLSPGERGEALVLRAQAHVAFGDLEAAQRDFVEILRASPSYEPDASLLPDKALERFKRARAAVVGDVVFAVAPPDARLFVDERPIPLPADGKVPLVAGQHVLRVERDGFDSIAQTIEVQSDRESRVELRLTPHARTIIVETEPDEVEVAIDGTSVGRTVRPAGEAAGVTARLVIENVELGEHVLTLTKPCFGAETVHDLLTVDLLDWSPKLYPLVRLRPVRATVHVQRTPPLGELVIDGEPQGSPPEDGLEVCPGERLFEVRLAGRRVWAERVALGEADDVALEVRARPNVTLVGPTDWPPELRALASSFNLALAAGQDGADPSRPEAWAALPLPQDTDLAIAPSRRAEPGEPAWWCYSPLLRTVARLDPARVELDAPEFSGVAWGLAVVDSLRRGPALVAKVEPGRPAASAGLSPGDRLVSLGGTQIDSASRAARILSVARANTPLDVEWLRPDGTAHRGRLEGRLTPRCTPPVGDGFDVQLRAAWAVVRGLAGGEAGAFATSSLALSLAAHGQSERAAELLAGIELGDRPGFGAGTIQYYLGCALQALGRGSEAGAALRAAAASSATAFDDEGPSIAPAARDRLFDLGVGAGR